MAKNIYQLDRVRIYLSEIQKAIDFMMNDDWFLANLTLKSLRVSCLSEINNNVSLSQEYLRFLKKMYQLLENDEDLLEHLIKIRSLCHAFIKNK
jgi:hypothetical protein